MTASVFLAAWALLAASGAMPRFLLPAPGAVLLAFAHDRALLATNAAITLAETLGGLVAGTVLGAGAALLVVLSPAAQRWATPVLVASQAIPVFALAPILVLWFGFGMLSKIVMATLVIFFPVMAAFADGLRRTDRAAVDLALTMGASRGAILRHVRLPAALPAFGAGLRVATAVAPIGAVIGEWVGAAGGLGFVMLNANARLETDLMFAALLLLAAMTIGLWVLVDRVLRRVLFWVPDTTGAP